MISHLLYILVFIYIYTYMYTVTQLHNSKMDHFDLAQMLHVWNMFFHYHSFAQTLHVWNNFFNVSQICAERTQVNVPYMEHICCLGGFTWHIFPYRKFQLQLFFVNQGEKRNDKQEVCLRDMFWGKALECSCFQC